MLDDEKDLFIKKKLQQDKTISSKANDIFKSFENQIIASEEIKSNENGKQIEFKPITEESKVESHKVANKESEADKPKVLNLFKKIRNFTAVAASFVVAISVGAGVAIYSNLGSQNGKDNSQYTEVNINKGSTASDYTVAEVKNEEVIVEEKVEKKVHENEYAKAVLTDDGSVAIQLKQAFLTEYRFKLDSSKMYKVSGINGTVKDVFVCSMVYKNAPYVLLLMEDNTVDVVQILNGEGDPYNTSEYKFNFYDQGKIEGLRNVKGFEEKTEPIANSDDMFYYVNAIKTDGSKKIIDNLEYVNMNDVSTNRVTFHSQDGERTYAITADDDKYIQAFGWAGASNNVYYINDNCLYHKSLVDGNETKLVTGVESIKTDDDGVIIVKLKFNNFIHKFDQYVKFEQYNVTDAKVIDTQEDENIILHLKEDGSISIELKDGGIERSQAKESFMENYIYNFYAGSYSIQVNNEYSNYDIRKQGVNYYANATAIYLGEIGADGKKCVAYSTKNNEVVIIDIYSFIQNSVGATFESEPGNDRYILSQGSVSSRISEMNETTLSMEFEDGGNKDCKAIEAAYSNGSSEILPIVDILNNEGYSKFVIVNKE